jgi:hypothetical protein
VSDELAFLRDVTAGLEVWFPDELSPHGARLMRALGVTVHIDPFGIPAGGCS